MHKTWTTFLQHLFGNCRNQLLQESKILFPETGFQRSEKIGPRPHALSGHVEFAKPAIRQAVIRKLTAEISACSPERVFISAENLGLPRSPEFGKALVEDLQRIGAVSIILVLRRQDKWIDSYYRTLLALGRNAETRDFRTYLREAGPRLLDYGVRYQPWKNAPFSGRFLVASYDDLILQDRVLSWFGEVLHVSNLANSLHVEQVPTYPSLTRLDAEITRLVNLVRDLEPAKRNTLLRHIYARGILPDAPFISGDIYEELRKCYEPKNKQLVDEWAIDPASEFINWRGTEKQNNWSADLATISDKLTAVSDALQSRDHKIRSKKSPLKKLKAMLGLIQTSLFEK